jgi:hypothetical protein
MSASGRGSAAPAEPTLVISLDLELAWGSFDHAYGPELLEMARWTHDHGAPALLDQLTRNGISATWAVVGIVMLDRLPDATPVAPFTIRGGRDWFSFVPPGATEESAPEWFGASFVRKLSRAEPRQELGFHGFSHVDLRDPRLPPERARQELELCAALARTFSLNAPSFVFPRNRIGHLDALRAAGMVAYRGPDALPPSLRSRWARRAWMVAADVLGLPPAVVRPRLADGLVEIPGSLMVRYLDGWRRFIPDASRLRRLRAGLKLLQQRGGILHVWFHPENLFFERPRLERVLAEFHAEAGELAAASRIRIRTMGQIAREALAARAGSAAERAAQR